MIKYLEVVAKTKTTGDIIPLYIIWESGKIFEIDKILEVKPIASTKGGGVGTRYKCKIKNKEKFLFFNDNRWWIETD